MSDPWIALRPTTRARIGLGRTGDSLPIKDVLEFQLAHAKARDAVHTKLDAAGLARAIAPLPSVIVRSRAADRETYLRRPDLGRQLDPACAADLTGPKLTGPGLTGPERSARQRSGPQHSERWDVVFVIADGLSPVGVQLHAVPVLTGCLDRLPGWSVAPIVIATQARVALGDEIGAAMDAKLCAVLIGERPGLSVADSLGIYLTYQPAIGRRDSERNCISNIHADGLSYAAAADMLTWLMTEACLRRLTGVGLKDDRVVAERAFPDRSHAPHRLE
jgi:ethanolamine ammonia-lyase small subunit